MSPVIEVRQLHKRYRDTVAVDDISFTVAEGEIFGILGPNGAGKTTTVECLEGLRTPDRGTVSVLGLDPRHERAELTQRLGVQLQDSQLPDKLRVDEALDLYSSFYRNPAVVAIDTPASLAEGVETEQRIQFRPSVPLAEGLLESLPDVTNVIHRGDVVVVTGNSNALNAVTSVLARHQIVARQLRVDQANLEDAFLALTGPKAPASRDREPWPCR
jgi:ABC-type Fe3+/spermidine/putrescine transport system ATPase subunit